jgi:hypothetical protein
MSHIIEASLALTGISLAVIAYEIHVLNGRSVSELKEKVNAILHKLENMWSFPKK